MNVLIVAQKSGALVPTYKLNHCNGDEGYYKDWYFFVRNKDYTKAVIVTDSMNTLVKIW